MDQGILFHVMEVAHSDKPTDNYHSTPSLLLKMQHFCIKMSKNN